MILDEEVLEGFYRDPEIDLSILNKEVASVAIFLPESLDLLSHCEEAMAEQLVDRVSEAVIEHRLFATHLLSWEEIVSDHELVRVVLDGAVL